MTVSIEACVPWHHDPMEASVLLLCPCTDNLPAHRREDSAWPPVQEADEWLIVSPRHILPSTPVQSPLQAAPKDMRYAISVAMSSTRWSCVLETLLGSDTMERLRRDEDHEPVEMVEVTRGWPWGSLELVALHVMLRVPQQGRRPSNQAGWLLHVKEQKTFRSSTRFLC